MGLARFSNLCAEKLKAPGVSQSVVADWFLRILPLVSSSILGRIMTWYNKDKPFDFTERLWLRNYPVVISFRYGKGTSGPLYWSATGIEKNLKNNDNYPFPSKEVGLTVPPPEPEDVDAFYYWGAQVRKNVTSPHPNASFHELIHDILQLWMRGAGQIDHYAPKPGLQAMEVFFAFLKKCNPNATALDFAIADEWFSEPSHKFGKSSWELVKRGGELFLERDEYSVPLRTDALGLAKRLLDCSETGSVLSLASSVDDMDIDLRSESDSIPSLPLCKS